MRKILFCGSLNVKTGGPAMSTSLTMLGLMECGDDARILMNKKEKGCKLRSEEIPILWSSKPYNEKTGYPWGPLSNDAFVKDCDLMHPQGVWDYNVRAISRMARKLGKPYIVSLRGMLYPQALKRSALKKKMFMSLFTSKVLSNAACIHATCEDEMIFYRDLGFKNPVTIIPNPIDISEKHETFCKTFNKNKFVIGYLGRLHKRKNVEALIKALAVLNKKYNNLELVIIGGGDDVYENELRTMAKELYVKNVKFCGFLSGEEKEDTLNSLSLLVMPSEFENFGNVILEGLVRQIPCIATKGSPWKVLEEHNCGWWVNYDQDDINRAIEEAVNKTDEQLEEMGKKGFMLVKSTFSKEIVGKKFHETYEWILGNKEKPEFVYE